MKITETASPAHTRERAGVPANHWGAVVCGLVVIGVAARLALLPTAPDVEDSILFVRGVIRHSLAEMRPHWPGYPVYIWLGKLITSLVGDPVLALHVISAVASALTAWPLAFVTRAWAISLGAEESRASWCGWTTAALWLVTPMAMVTGSQIISDPLGLLLGATLLAWCVVGERRGTGPWIAAAVLGGIMVGVRLVNVTMLVPLVAECGRRRAERWRGVRAPLAMLAAGAIGVLPWLAWLAVREPAALIQGGATHVGGHFQQFGGSVWTDPEPLGRPFRALRTVALYGLGAGVTEARAVVVAAGWAATLVVAARGPWRGAVTRLVALWAVPHLLYVLLGHDLGYPRYMMSAVAVLCMVAGLAPLRAYRTGLASALVALVATAAVSAPVALQQHRQAPVEIQLARFLARRVPAGIVVVDHPGITFYLQGEGDVVAVESTAQEVPRWREAWASAGRETFTTDPPPQDPAGWIPVAHFCRDPRINVYLSGDLWLFAPVASPLGRAGPVTACDER